MMKLKSHPVLSRTSLYTILLVALLFAVLPLSQRILGTFSEDMMIVRPVDIVPPPPPQPQERESVDSGASSAGGVNLKSIEFAVNLDPIATGANSKLSNSFGFGINEFGLNVKSHATFTMTGVGFGVNGLDRSPIMLVRPSIRTDYMREKGIEHFDTVVLVKWRKNGSLTFISIEEIEYPDPELAAMVRETIPRIRYSKPTIDGEPVERFVRLPLTLHAN